MKLNLDFEIIDLQGKALPAKGSEYIADMLLEHKGDSLKLYELAMNINKNKSIDIDMSDLKLIEEAVKAHPRYTNLIKGAILKEIECQKISDKNDKK